MYLIVGIGCMRIQDNGNLRIWEYGNIGYLGIWKYGIWNFRNLYTSVSVTRLLDYNLTQNIKHFWKFLTIGNYGDFQRSIMY